MPHAERPNATPILPGFYPDPSICRVGDTCYVATSTFEYLPGVPIHASEDLEHWRFVGHAYHRPEQLDLSAAGSSGGLFAPTLRHHDGVFYLITTDIARAGEGQLITRSSTPEGPWSIPLLVPGAFGIDPDLFWDTDGTCHLTWTGASDAGLTGILSVPVNPRTGERLGPIRKVWQGTGLMAHPEGPHLYRIDDYYYCLLAEGGTERGHGVTIARARSLDGPWQPHPANPFLSHRSTAHPIQNAGHADLVELVDGTWAMVHLGVRPRGRTPGFHVNGRESFVVGIEWRDGWPVVVEDRFAPAETPGFEDAFPGSEDEDSTLAPHWVSPGGRHRSLVRSAAPAPGIVIEPTDSPGQPSLAVRARHENWRAEVALTPTTSHDQGTPDGAACLLVSLDTEHWAELRVVTDGSERWAEVELSALGLRQVLGHIDVEPAASGAPIAGAHSGLTLVASAHSYPPAEYPAGGPDEVSFAVVDAAGEHEVAHLDGRLLATEVAGGFTGRMIGLRASGGPVTVTSVRYAPVD